MKRKISPEGDLNATFSPEYREQMIFGFCPSLCRCSGLDGIRGSWVGWSAENLRIGGVFGKHIADAECTWSERKSLRPAWPASTPPHSPNTVETRCRYPRLATSAVGETRDVTG
jgi:hypothetical protein